MNPHYYEDLPLEARFTTVGRTVTEADVMIYAALSGDYNQLHTDAEFAAGSVFGQRVAHGFLGRAIFSGLTARLGIFEGTAKANLSLDHWVFKAPIFIGDTVHGELDVADRRLTSKGTDGVVTFACRLINQRGEVTQEGRQTLLMACRPEEG